MSAIIEWIEQTFARLPIPLLEVWGALSYVIGFLLALFAFGGFTFRPGGGWGLGRERQAWDVVSFLSIPLTFVLIVVTGYLGSFIVLVPGAQTFESLKDLVVFLCIVLFGYPALITVPFAYGLSDLIEGVPPESLLAWLPGYFINPTCFWLAYQLFGRDPDLRKLRTWGSYLVFALLFLASEPILWGYICAGTFSPEISYRSITPALLFTTSITWVVAPVALLGAYPLAKRLGLFWAAIAGHVKERRLGKSEWIWEAGKRDAPDLESGERSYPIRMLILAPFIALVLLMVGVTAYVTLSSASEDATRLALRLHEEIGANIKLRVDDYLAGASNSQTLRQDDGLSGILERLPIAEHGRAFILDSEGKLVASSAAFDDEIVRVALQELRLRTSSLPNTASNNHLRFSHVTAKPLTRETWLANVTSYDDPERHPGWLLVTALPEGYYLAGVRTGNSQSAMVFSLALLLSLAIAAPLASMVTTPLRRMSRATSAVAAGDLEQRVPTSRLEELGVLGKAFNDMAGRLGRLFDELRSEVVKRKERERELEDSEARLRVSENRVQLAVTAANLGIWDWDVQKDYLHWDESMYRLYGVAHDEFTGAYEAWRKCVVPEDVEQAEADVQAALKGEREFDSSFRVRRSDGSVRIIKGMAKTHRDTNGHAVRLVGLNWDVTEQLRAEQELRQHKARLEELVLARTRALHLAKEQADFANRAKSTFLANISHEIRTPMNAILGFGQLLERDRSLSAQGREHLAKIMASGYHLLEVINNVLEMSKIEAGRMDVHTTTFDLPAAIRDVDAIVRGGIEARGLWFNVAGIDTLPRLVSADAVKLRQILINLLSNAAQFTPQGGVTLRARAHDLDATHVLFECDVEDTGVGIAREEFERVFEPFLQTQSGLQRQKGSGLGMAISREFARLMGGDLRLESEAGVGSKFTLSLKLELGIANASTETAVFDPAALEGRPLCVLVVDDHEHNRAFLRELLSSAGVRVVEAADGEAAVSVFLAQQPDLVFMDVKMPVLDGLEATRKIRTLPSGTAVPIVMLSASVLHGEGQSVLATGANQFIAKPFKAEEILGALAKYLGGLKGRAAALGRLPEQNNVTFTQVAALGDETLNGIREAIRLGYVQRIPKLLSGLGEEHAPVVSELSELARTLDLERLTRLVGGIGLP
jgi:PAS domain S-box-containing protein